MILIETVYTRNLLKKEVFFKNSTKLFQTSECPSSMNFLYFTASEIQPAWTRFFVDLPTPPNAMVENNNCTVFKGFGFSANAKSKVKIKASKAFVCTFQTKNMNEYCSISHQWQKNFFFFFLKNSQLHL